MIILLPCRFTTSSPTHCVTDPCHTLPPVDVDVKGVTRLLCNLQLHKAPGPNSIPPRFLKDTATNIAPILILSTIFEMQGRL